MRSHSTWLFRAVLGTSALLAFPALAAGAAKAKPAAAAGAERATRACAAPIEAGAPTELTLGARKATAAGSRLTFKDKDADGKLVLGVIGPVNEDSGANILALRNYLRFFTDQKADAIVVTGDIAETPAGVARILGELSATHLPVFAVIGNRDCEPDFTQGIALAQKQFKNVVNLDAFRAVEFPEATLVSLPGYHDPNFIQCTAGCRYYKGTVEETIQLAKEAKSPVVLVSHGPPRGSGTQAIDFAPATGNVGDPEIARAVQEAKIPFGVHSNIKEAGARATDAVGTTLVPPDTLARELFLNPGPANTATMGMNDKTKSSGFAAVLAIRGAEASWTLYRGKPLTPAEKKDAKALDPKAPDEDDAAASPAPAPAKKPAPVAKPPPGPSGSSANTP